VLVGTAIPPHEVPRVARSASLVPAGCGGLVL